MFTCNKCQQEFDDALQLARRKVCRSCYSAQLKDYKDRHRAEIDAYNADYRVRNREAINAWRRNNRDKVNPTQQAWRDNNWKRVRETQNRWHRERMTIDPIYAAKVRASRRGTTISRRAVMNVPVSRHFAGEISAFYGNCPEGYQVDHIAPLLGKSACGLHVPWNLQYMLTQDNQRKNNREL